MNNEEVHLAREKALAALDPRSYTTFDAARQMAWEFEKILNSLGITIPHKSNSMLAETILELGEMEEQRLGRQKINPTRDIRPSQRRIVGLIDIMSRTIKAYQQGRIEQFKAHLALLPDCEFAQNIEFRGGWGQAVAEDKTNKVFELLLGLACGQVGSDLIMDPPNVVASKNPDILVTIGGRRWGFPCKVVYGANPRSFLDNVIKGVDQIEKSPADTGIVVVNLKNAIQHDDFWPVLRYEKDEPIFGVHPNEDVAFDRLKAFAEDWHAKLVDATTTNEIDVAVRGKKSNTVKGVLLFLQTTVGVTKEGLPVPTNLGILSLMRFGQVSNADMQVFEQLNAALRFQ